MASVRRNIVANFAGKAVVVALGLVFPPLYVKWLGAEYYALVGVFAMLNAFMGILDLGLTTTLNREVARLSAEASTGDPAYTMRELVSTFGAAFWIVGGVAGGTVVLVAAPLSHWFNTGGVPHGTIVTCLRLMGLILALQWPCGAYMGALLGLQRQVTVNGIQIACTVLRWIGATCVMWLVSRSIEAFFVWQATVAAVQTLAMWWVVERGMPRRTGPKSARGWGVLAANWKFSAGMTVLWLLALALTQEDKVIMSRMLTLKEFGYYTLGWTAGGTLNFITASVVMAVFPRLSQLVKQGSERDIADFYHHCCQLVTTLLVPAAIVLATFSREVVFAWCGDVTITEATYRVVCWVAIGTCLNGLVNMPYFLQLAYAWTSLSIATNTAAIIIMAPTVYLLARAFGPPGAASAWCVLNAGYVVIGTYLMHRRILRGEQWRWYFVDVGIPTLAALAPAIVVRLLAAAPPRTRVEALLTVVSAAPLSLLAAAAAAPVVRRQITIRMEGFVRRFGLGLEEP